MPRLSSAGTSPAGPVTHAPETDAESLGQALRAARLGRELSDWILAELTEVKQISIDIAKVRQ